MSVSRNESIRRIVGAGKGTVREHITVKIIISIPYFGLICKLLDKKTAAPESAAGKLKLYNFIFN